MVRLRSPHAPDTFLPEDNVVGTMLHEVRTLWHMLPLSMTLFSALTIMTHTDIL